MILQTSIEIIREKYLIHYFLPGFRRLIETCVPNGEFWLGESVIGKFTYSPQLLVALQVDAGLLEENQVPEVHLIEEP
jgi:hypothetical protein